MDVITLLSATPSGGPVSAYGEEFKAVTRPTRPAAQNLRHAVHIADSTVTFAETPARQVAKTVLEATEAVAPVARKATVSDAELEILKAGGRIEIPARFQEIRLYMCDITAATSEEVFLFRAKDGKRYVILGETVDGVKKVRVPRDATRAIAHTHPSGNLSLSPDDIKTLINMKQNLHVLIDPYLNHAKMFFGVK